MPGKGVYEKAKILPRTEIVTEDDQWFIGDFCLVTVPKLKLGSGAQINAGSKILGRDVVSIGRNSVVSYDVLILTSTDSPDPPRRKHNDFSPESERLIVTKPVTIGNECFIGAKSILMPGSYILDNKVIPAGSYVCLDSTGKTAIHHWKLYP